MYTMEIFIGIMVLLVVLQINFFLAGIASDIAADKGYVQKKHFHICLWLGLVGYLIIIAMPDLKAREQREALLLLLNKMQTEYESAAAPTIINTAAPSKDYVKEQQLRPTPQPQRRPESTGSRQAPHQRPQQLEPTDHPPQYRRAGRTLEDNG